MDVILTEKQYQRLKKIIFGIYAVLFVSFLLLIVLEIKMDCTWHFTNEWYEHGVFHVLPCITILYESDPWWDKGRYQRVLRQYSIQFAFLTHSVTLDVELLGSCMCRIFQL